jgi:hypothetical protein
MLVGPFTFHGVVMIRIALAVLFTLLAVVSFNAGMSYINEGYGLHPLLAFGVMFLAILAIVAMMVYAYIIHRFPELIDAYNASTSALESIASGLDMDARYTFHAEAANARSRAIKARETKA